MGNHEAGYGVPQLLLLDKMANSPIVSANLYVKGFEKRLVQPHSVIKKAGFEVLFTGVVSVEGRLTYE